jgi:Xaa-Pro aminopeptidase
MSSYEARLQALREQLKADRLDGFVVPLTDEHMSEYVGSYAQRLAWLTGFQGSAGSAAVLPEEAAIFTDGRYTIQVPRPGRREALELPIGTPTPASPIG